MPNTLITIEQVADRWMCEIEIGGMVAHRQTIRAGDFESAIDQVYTEYRKRVPEEPKRPPAVPDVPLQHVTMPESRVVSRKGRAKPNRPLPQSAA